MQAAIETAELYAAADRHALKLGNAAYANDVLRMRSLVDALPVPVASPHRAAAVKTFVDFIDPQRNGTGAYAAALTGSLEALRRRHRCRSSADL